MPFDHYNTPVLSLSSQARLSAQTLVPSLTARVTSGKLMSSLPHLLRHKRGIIIIMASSGNYNNQLTLKPLTTGPGTFSKHYLLLLARISNRSPVFSHQVVGGSYYMGTSIFQYNLPQILRQLVQVLGASAIKRYSAHSGNYHRRVKSLFLTRIVLTTKHRIEIILLVRNLLRPL